MNPFRRAQRYPTMVLVMSPWTADRIRALAVTQRVADGRVRLGETDKERAKVVPRAVALCTTQEYPGPAWDHDVNEK